MSFHPYERPSLRFTKGVSTPHIERYLRRGAKKQFGWKHPDSDNIKTRKSWAYYHGKKEFIPSLPPGAGLLERAMYNRAISAKHVVPDVGRLAARKADGLRQLQYSRLGRLTKPYLGKYKASIARRLELRASAARQEARVRRRSALGALAPRLRALRASSDAAAAAAAAVKEVKRQSMIAGIRAAREVRSNKLYGGKAPSIYAAEQRAAKAAIGI